MVVDDDVGDDADDAIDRHQELPIFCRRVVVVVVDVFFFFDCFVVVRDGGGGALPLVDGGDCTCDCT